MSYWKELLSQILRDMRQHKLRTLLAMFGVMWGVFTTIMLLAVGEAYYTTSKSNVMRVADNSLVLLVGTTSKPYKGHPIGQPIYIKATDVEALRQALPQIEHISPVLSFPNMILSRNNQQISLFFQGVSADYGKITKQQPQTNGRFFNPLDIQLQHAVIFIEDSVQKKLFGNASAINQDVWLNGMPFRVVGVAQPEKTDMMQGGYFAYIPYTKAIKLWGDKNVPQIILQSREPHQVKELKYQLTHYLSTKYHFDPTDKEAMTLVDLTQFTQFFTWFFTAIKFFLGLCGAITLGIGGIGVSNMMYLIVTERTPEIGLRMALGAKPKDILWQFMLESSVMVMLGSVIGLTFAIITLNILQHMQLPRWLGTPVFSGSVFSITLIILMIIAGITAYFPAKRAAALVPIQALAF